jgi:protein-S-isoprenylcysteine O-methyltransferase Ste14
MARPREVGAEDALTSADIQRYKPPSHFAPRISTMEQALPKRRFEEFADFLVVQRVTISLFVFSLLLAKDIATGAKPHDTWNLHDPFALGGMALVIAGLAIRSWAAGVIKKTKVLATSGPYLMCRHPLYLGSLLMMLGFCILASNLFDACIVFGPVLSIYILTMRREERRLAERHGEAWRQYANSAPRLLPYRLFTDLFSIVRTDWSFAQWLNNREYNAAVTTIVALACLHFWGTL